MRTNSLKLFISLFVLLNIHAATARAWELPPDSGTVSEATIAEIQREARYPATMSYEKEVFFQDFLSYGKKFTQVTIRLTPDQPRRRNGKNLVVVAAAPGSEYGGDFLTTVEEKEGMGPWLARRGITFIALTRVGRWNFLADDGSGSWEAIPIEERMPIFNRDQEENWPRDDYIVDVIEQGETPAASDIHRYPKPGTELYEQTLAATPVTLLRGFQLGLQQVLPAEERAGSTVLYWGMSTGGAFLWPLARRYKPDGYLGYGTSSSGLAYLYRNATLDDYENPYIDSFLRIRQRGYADHVGYTQHIDPSLRRQWWQQSLRNPRFKSVEDAMMGFNIGALSEMAVRLWRAGFLPQAYRRQGFSRFMKQILDTSFPPENIGDIAALELNGTLDEPQPPATVDAHRAVMEEYVAEYRVARIEGFHHYLFTQDMITTVGNLWLAFIDSGYFDRGAAAGGG